MRGYYGTATEGHAMRRCSKLRSTSRCAPGRGSVRRPRVQRISPDFITLEWNWSPDGMLLVLRPAGPPEPLLCFYRCRYARKSNLANATPDKIEQLTQVCEPASSDHSKEEVTDETRCECRKIENNSFSPLLVPQHTDLIKVVRNYLLEGTDSTRQIDIELYELNVYSASDPHPLLADTKFLR
jgi:hypothetical protein